MRELGQKQRLSKRELEVARLVTQGLTNKEIASTLFISQRTAEGHVAQICNKLGFSTRAQIAAWAATLDARATASEVEPKAKAVEPAAAPSTTSTTPTTARPVRPGAAARWVGVSILVVGLLSAGLLAMLLAPRTSAPPPYVLVADGLTRPAAIAVDSTGAILVLEGDRVVKLVGASITPVAGSGTTGFSGDGESATQAELQTSGFTGLVSEGLAVDGRDNLYIADYANHRVRKVSTDGKITTIAGTGVAGWSGDEGPAINAKLWYPRGLAFDRIGNLFIADSGNNRVRMVDSNGNIHTVAGNGETGDAGDGGPALEARFNAPAGVAVDTAGNLYIADSANNQVRVVSGGTITRFAGSGVLGFSGDGRPARDATLGLPAALATDSRGDVFVVDSYNNHVRMIDAAGTITTIAAGVSLNKPLGIAVDGKGGVLVADTYNDRILRLQR